MSLDPLLADGVIDEVLGRLKSGKEADIWLVRRADAIVAAKVYKDRDRRSFKNNADYKEGRDVRNSRTRRAIESGSTFGREAEEQAWKTAEADALNLLHASGVRVPRPILFTEGVLLMEIVVGADGQPAPRMIDVADLRGQARSLYQDLRQQIIRMLCCEIIHGDLSEYNILAGISGPTIIDFPQIVSPSHNSRAEYFFLRDFENVLRFLAAHDRELLAFVEDGKKIWNAYTRRQLTPDFRPSPPGTGGSFTRGGDRDRRPQGGQRPPQAPRAQQPPRPPQPPRAQQPPRPPQAAPPPRAPHPQPPPTGSPAPDGTPRKRRRRRRGRGGANAPNGGGPPQPGAPANAGAPRPPNAPRGANPPRGGNPAQPPRPPKLPGWLQRAASRGGKPRPISAHPNEKKPFRRRKRRF